MFQSVPFRPNSIFGPLLMPSRSSVVQFTPGATGLTRLRVIFETPTHCRLVVSAGVIYANSSEIAFDGITMFTNNSAAADGGEKRDGTCLACNVVHSSAT